MEEGVQSATTSWSQFCSDWDSSISSPLYLVPGNHDISNAIGYSKVLSPEKDASSAAGIFNRMMRLRWNVRWRLLIIKRIRCIIPL